jgi:hypothetical protein
MNKFTYLFIRFVNERPKISWDLMIVHGYTFVYTCCRVWNICLLTVYLFSSILSCDVDRFSLLMYIRQIESHHESSHGSSQHVHFQVYLLVLICVFSLYLSCTSPSSRFFAIPTQSWCVSSTDTLAKWFRVNFLIFICISSPCSPAKVNLCSTWTGVCASPSVIPAR